MAAFPAAFQWQAIAIAMKASLLSAAHVAFSKFPSKLPASLRFVFTLPNRQIPSSSSSSSSWLKLSQTREYYGTHALPTSSLLLPHSSFSFAFWFRHSLTFFIALCRQMSTDTQEKHQTTSHSLFSSIQFPSCLPPGSRHKQLQPVSTPLLVPPRFLHL